MAYLLKQSTALKVPVIMFSPDHQTELTGVTTPVVKAMYEDGSHGTIVPTSWTEVDSVNMKGLYLMGIGASDIGIIGPFVLYITSASPASDITKREFVISASLVDDITGGGGGGSISVINTNLNALIATVGAPSDLSAAATVFGKIRSLADTVGTANDSPAGTTVFAKLLTIINNTSTITSTLAAIEGTSFNTSTDSLHVLAAALGTAQTDITRIRRINEGRWRIDALQNKLFIYDSNGTSILLTFNLKDAGGAPTATNIFERAP